MRKICQPFVSATRFLGQLWLIWSTFGWNFWLLFLRGQFRLVPLKGFVGYLSTDRHIKNRFLQISWAFPLNSLKILHVNTLINYHFYVFFSSITGFAFTWCIDFDVLEGYHEPWRSRAGNGRGSGCRIIVFVGLVNRKWARPEGERGRHSNLLILFTRLNEKGPCLIVVDDHVP